MHTHIRSDSVTYSWKFSCDSFITGHLAGEWGFFTGGKPQSESMIMGS